MKTRQQFLEAGNEEKNIFISKLMHAITNDDDAFREVAYVVRSAEITGMFHNVKFGADAVYKNEEPCDA